MKKNISRLSLCRAGCRISRSILVSASKKLNGACTENIATNATDYVMTSITISARIATVFAIALTFAMPLCPPLLAFDDHNPIGVTGAFEGVTTTGGAYNVLNHNAIRQIDDIVVAGAIGRASCRERVYHPV